MRQYVIDAFTDHVFAGNPAAVCLMDRWLGEAKMMAITIENNRSETAFAVREGEKYHLRWFTPGGEIDLCGHATLGTACAIMTFVEPERTQITFSTLSGRPDRRAPGRPVRDGLPGLCAAAGAGHGGDGRGYERCAAEGGLHGARPAVRV